MEHWQRRGVAALLGARFPGRTRRQSAEDGGVADRCCLGAEFADALGACAGPRWSAAVLLDADRESGEAMNERSLGAPMSRERDVKTKIEVAAVRLFAEQGVAETSIREIAAAA